MCETCTGPDDVSRDAVQAFAAVIVTGPRSVGTTTTVARLTTQVDRLDVPGIAAIYGVVLHAGGGVLELGDRIVAVRISAAWA